MVVTTAVAGLEDEVGEGHLPRLRCWGVLTVPGMDVRVDALRVGVADFLFGIATTLRRTHRAVAVRWDATSATFDDYAFLRGGRSQVFGHAASMKGLRRPV